MKHILLGTLVLVLAADAIANEPLPLLAQSFDGSAAPSDWTHQPGTPPSGQWVAPGAGGKGHCLTATSGMWQGPLLTLEPFEYYRLTFKGKSPGKCYWLVNYYLDGETKEYPVDHYNCFEASKDWEAKEYYFRCIADVKNARLAFRPMDDKPAWIDDAVIEKADRKSVVKWADRIYAAMPPLKYSASADRWQLIPKTMEALRQKKTLKVVMLGDSIVNDTGNSAYDVRIERMYPGARWNIVQSTRGSTGCKAYKEGRVKEMVLDPKPDFLMIGGISNGDAESVRTVIQQVRAARPELEILVMSGPIGRVDPFKHPEWNSEPQPGEYRTQLAQVAADEKCEFLDMETIWGNYVKTSGKTWEYFTRDELHGNSQGRQVLSKILESFFAPK